MHEIKHLFSPCARQHLKLFYLWAGADVHLLLLKCSMAITNNGSGVKVRAFIKSLNYFLFQHSLEFSMALLEVAFFLLNSADSKDFNSSMSLTGQGVWAQKLWNRIFYNKPRRLRIYFVSVSSGNQMSKNYIGENKIYFHELAITDCLFLAGLNHRDHSIHIERGCLACPSMGRQDNFSAWCFLLS